MRRLPFLLALTSLVLAAQAPAPTRPNAPVTHAALTAPVEGFDTPTAALAELAAGNGRFAIGKRIRTMETGHDAAMRAALMKGQSPFAVIITCSDSRVPESLVFDQEAGRLFTIREAGNAPDLQGLADAGKVQVVPALYHLDSGKVQFLKPLSVIPAPQALH